MDLLFGDATTAAPTPAIRAERGSLMGSGSPPHLNIRRGRPGPGDAIPGLNIDPPKVSVENGKPQLASNQSRNNGDGMGAWVSRILQRGRASGNRNDARSAHYRPLEQVDDE